MVLRLYLDTNVASYLIERPAGDSRPIRLRLIAASQRGLIRVQGSLEVLAEAAGVFQYNEGLFREINLLQIDLIESRWMYPLVERWRKEVAAGGALNGRELYLRRRMRRTLGSLTRSTKTLLEIGRAVADEAERYRIDAESARSEIRARLSAETDLTDQRRIRKAYQEWFKQVDTSEWCRSMLDDGVVLGQILKNSSWDDPQARVPSLWNHMRFRLARIAMEVGENRRIKGSDEYDARHYSAAATYADILATEDSVLRDTCALLDPPGLRVMNLEELDGLLLRLTKT